MTVILCLQAQLCAAVMVVRVPKHMRARLWELGLFSLAERKLKGLSTAGGLRLLKGQLEKGWS